MAVKLDNLDDVMKQFYKMEKAVDLEVIRLARKRMRAVMRSLVPEVKKISPKDTGDLIKSIKVKSSSKRGISRARIVWMVKYAGPLNFKKDQSAEKYATNFWAQNKSSLDQEGAKIVKESMKAVLESHGVKVI